MARARKDKPKAAPSASSKNTLVLPPTSDWYTALPVLPPSPAPLPALTSAKLSDLTDRASKLLSADAESYLASSASTGSGPSDAHFLQTILTRGTLSDRLSALTLLVQASPVHNTKALDTLKGLAERGRGKGGREEGLKAVRCVVDWWVGGGAPDRKLRYFRDQPLLLHPSVTDQHLVIWYFEDWLKKYFFTILQILETFSLDPLNYVRTQSLAFISTLLREKPEQEQNLLRLLVNKLGDTEKAICSRASYHLLQLLQAHPNMKSVIVREIKALIFRPAASTSAVAQAANKPNTHIVFADADTAPKAKADKKGKGKEKDGGAQNMERWNTHAWYYAAVTLNQVVLTPSEHDREVARTLVGMYFEMFQEILGAGKKPDTDKADDDGINSGDEQEGKGHKRRNGKGKAKAKEVKGAAGFTEVEDASSKMISAVLTGVNRALPFAKVDVGSGDKGFRDHIDTLFLITHTSTFNISLQALMLILQITASLASIPSSSTSDRESFATALTDRFYRTLYASLIDPRLSTSNKQAMYLNLVFKALKADRNIERVKAFVRRFVQVLTAGVGGAGGGAEFTAGGLYLLGELFNTTPSLKSMLSTRPPNANDAEVTEYDPHKRDPQYAHASASPLYELLPLLNHYHPAIALHAQQLFDSTPMTASPDLALNTLTHFLDRFVYKNPKKPRTRGPSAMQPSAAPMDGTSVKLVRGEAADAGLVNEEEFVRRRPEDVPVDQMFFHKFFTKKKEKEREKAARIGRRKGHGGNSDSDVESGEDGDDSEDEPEAEDDAGEGASNDENSDAEEAEIWKVMKASMPAELQDADLLGDSDDLPSELDEDESDDDADAGDESGEEDIQKTEEDNSGEESDALSLAEASDADDLLSLDAEVPMGLIEYDGSDRPDVEQDEEEEWGGISGTDSKPKKRKRGEDGKERRKRLRALPTFASYEDYAKMIEDGPEDNV
ncbi:CBF-domain-containing protein [Amylocystis lapponica]|nr:CBF-domain-containing protein [Amylocystis lapponica]